MLYFYKFQRGDDNVANGLGKLYGLKKKVTQMGNLIGVWNDTNLCFKSEKTKQKKKKKPNEIFSLNVWR